MDKAFWEEKWQAEKQGWDMGHVSPPIKRFIDELEDKNMSILIPGAGNAYEAEYLHEQGFTNVFVLDITEAAINKFKERCPDFPADNIIQGDFFKLQGTYDLIVEQTFFCAIDPKLREAYCEQMHKLLKEGGRLVGLLFNFPLESGPPFGGNMEDYVQLFESKFENVHMRKEEESISPRKDRELWIDISH